MADLLTKIESLRTKPVSVRNRYAFWGALAVTALITVLWLTTLPARFDDAVALQKEAQAESDSSFAAPFARMRETVSGALGSLKQQLGALSEEESAAPAKDPNMLDFEAMVASSSERVYEEFGEAPVATSSTSTVATSTATSSRSTR